MRRHRRRCQHAAPSPATRIRVAGGFQPDIVYGRTGEPMTLIFRREERTARSERVVFPQLGKSAMLPRDEDVAVELRPPRAGTYDFTCQMSMLRGRLIVEDET